MNIQKLTLSTGVRAYIDLSTVKCMSKVPRHWTGQTWNYDTDHLTDIAFKEGDHLHVMEDLDQCVKLWKNETP